MDEDGAAYEVGYGKPPKKSQFTKGNSGNQRGRPKGSKNLHSLILKESRQRVRLNGPNGTKTVSKLEAVIMQLSNKSAKGDLRASRDFLTLVQRGEEVRAILPKPGEFGDADKKTMESILARVKALKTDETS